MKDIVLLELADRWEKEAIGKSTGKHPDGSVSVESDKVKARSATLRECSDALRMLVSIIGDKR